MNKKLIFKIILFLMLISICLFLFEKKQITKVEDNSIEKKENLTWCNDGIWGRYQCEEIKIYNIEGVFVELNEEKLILKVENCVEEKTLIKKCTKNKPFKQIVDISDFENIHKLKKFKNQKINIKYNEESVILSGRSEIIKQPNTIRNERGEGVGNFNSIFVRGVIDKVEEGEIVISISNCKEIFNESVSCDEKDEMKTLIYVYDDSAVGQEVIVEFIDEPEKIPNTNYYYVKLMSLEKEKK